MDERDYKALNKTMTAKERVNNLNPISYKQELEKAMEDHAEAKIKEYKIALDNILAVLQEVLANHVASSELRDFYRNKLK